MNLAVLNSISYGLYAVGVKAPEGRPSACVVNALMQVTAEPAYVCVCVNHNNYTNECIKRDKLFTVSVFGEDATFAQIASLGFKSGRDTDKLEGYKYRTDSDGLPILEENICAWFKCRVISTTETPTHTLVIAEVIDTAAEQTGKPITYDYYRTVLKGKVSKNAAHL